MDLPSEVNRLIRAFVAVALVAVLAGCASASEVEVEDTSAQLTTQAEAPTGAPEGAACITVSATWVGHIQYFIQDGYTVTRAAAVPAGDGYTAIAVVYTSPAGEEIVGSWGTGGDPSSETVMQVFPLDDVTGSHTVVMMPNSNILAEAGLGIPNSVACLG